MSEPPAFDPQPDRPERGPPLRPKPAATLILVRRDGPKPRVLMGRRHRGHAFMPSLWVFPGGRVDRADYRAPAASELDAETAARLARTGPRSLARALGMAAVRETFEEAGLLLAGPASPRPAAGPWAPFLEHGVAADLAALAFVARAITPPRQPRRFDARFFMAEAERLVSLDPLPDCGELDEIAWVELDEARTLDLPSITRFILSEIEARLQQPDRPILSLRHIRGVQRTDIV